LGADAEGKHPPARFGPGSTLLLLLLLQTEPGRAEPTVGITPEYCREAGLCDIPSQPVNKSTSDERARDGVMGRQAADGMRTP